MGDVKGKSKTSAEIKKGSIKKETCKECKKNVDKGRVIQCDSCRTWLHQTCSGLMPSEFEILISGNELILFNCSECLTRKGTENKRLMNLENKVDDIAQQAAKIDSLKDIIAEFRQQNEILMKFIANYSEEKLEEKIKSQVTAILKEDRDKQEKEKEETADEKERLEKKHNIVIFNVEEQAGEEEDQEKDLEEVKAIIQITTPNIDLSALSKDSVKRLGYKRKAHTGSTTRPRAIQVILPKTHPKATVLKNAQEVRKNPKYSKVGIQHDKTRKELLRDKELRAEIDERRKNGEDVMIFRDRVILRKDRDYWVQQSVKNRANRGEDEVKTDP